MGQVILQPERQRTLAATFAAGAVAAVLLLQDVLGSVSWLLVGLTQEQFNVGGSVQQFVMTLGFGALVLLTFAVGVWVSLWRIAPLAGGLTLTAVLLRGLLAAAVGAVLVFALQFGLNMIGPFSGAGPLWGNAFPWPGLDGTIQAFTMAIQAGFGALVRQAPVVVLAVVLAWLWLQKHPSRVDVSTDAGEV